MAYFVLMCYSQSILSPSLTLPTNTTLLVYVQVVASLIITVQVFFLDSGPSMTLGRECLPGVQSGGYGAEKLEKCGAFLKYTT